MWIKCDCFDVFQKCKTFVTVWDCVVLSVLTSFSCFSIVICHMTLTAQAIGWKNLYVEQSKSITSESKRSLCAEELCISWPVCSVRLNLDLIRFLNLQTSYSYILLILPVSLSFCSLFVFLSVYHHLHLLFVSFHRSLSLLCPVFPAPRCPLSPLPSSTIWCSDSGTLILWWVSEACRRSWPLWPSITLPWNLWYY